MNINGAYVGICVQLILPYSNSVGGCLEFFQTKVPLNEYRNIKKHTQLWLLLQTIHQRIETVDMQYVQTIRKHMY